METKELQKKNTSHLIGRIEGLIQSLRVFGDAQIYEIGDEIDKVLEILFERELETLS